MLRIKGIGIKIMVFLSIIGYILSGLYIVLNLYSIDANTSVLNNDSSSIEVINIDDNETLYLEDGSEVNGSDITSYVKVNRGSGTWYIEDDLLAVEVVFSDLIGMLLINIFYMAVLLVFIIRSQGSKKYNIARNIILLLFIIYSFVNWFVIGSYLDRVL